MILNNLRKYVLQGCLLVALLFTACAPAGGAQPTPEPVKLKVVVLPYLSYTPLFIAEEEGYFVEQGIEIEFIEMRQSSEAYALLAEGDLDVTSGFGAGYLNAITRGAKMRVVADKGYLAATGCASSAFLARQDLVKAGELDHVAQLKGRTVSFQSGNVAEFSVGELLKTAGLTIDDIKNVDVPAPARVEALANGTIDFTFVSEPWVTRIVNAGGGVVWMPAQELLPDFQLSTILYGSSLLDENPDAGRRFMVAYLKAVRQFNEGKTERNLELMAKHTGLDKELLEQACWPPFRDDGRINVQSVLDFQAWALEKGYLDSIVAEDQFWDPSFVEYANQELETPAE